MITKIPAILRIILLSIPFVLFALLNNKANLKKEKRYRQLPMVVLALIYCVVFMFLIEKVNGWIFALLNWLPNAFQSVAKFFDGLWDGKLSFLADAARFISKALQNFLKLPDLRFILLFITNALIMLAHIIVKRILITLMQGLFSKSGGIYDKVASLFYDYDSDTDTWYVRPHLLQGRTFVKTLYWAGFVIAVLSLMVSAWMFQNDLLAVPFYPVFGLIILGELYFAVDGLSKEEAKGSLTGETEEKSSVANYSLLRQTLRKLFGDKLVAEDTTIHNDLAEEGSVEQSLAELQESPENKEEAYGYFIQKKIQNGMVPDQNYIVSGRDLLNGKSILFNNPFYYDLIPYAFYAMNRVLLQKEKVLIVLGRHNTEDDIAAWCESGLRSVTNISEMWNIGVLSDKEQDLDVGILTRSCLHDQKLLESNAAFFREVHFAVLIEPSRLLTTAQVGLNSMLNLCRSDDKTITFCSTDKNCDGLVDALSHLLMTSISEVSATRHHDGTCSYMCWETDEEHWQHRMLPNLSRYLGVGTELSFSALKNQVSKTFWYGGDAFPVIDIRWIANQYNYELLHYAELPVGQDTMDKVFEVSPNLWDMKKEENSYLTVEDESYNMFEIKRDFATRSANQSFINIISPEYLLKDYMAKNNALFNTDPKAIPYIVADYARTPRNVALRMTLRMSIGYVPEKDLRRELLLIDADMDDLLESLWHEICAACQPVRTVHMDEERGELLYTEYQGKQLVFDKSIIETRRKFSVETGRMETMYHISDASFRNALLGDLRNASYIAEDENGEASYLGSELQGHIFQKYLPGQFFTFSGKYYEMLSVTSDGKVLVRRAADHINGRPSYRQVRHYRLYNAENSKGMGDIRTSHGLRITRQFADISVSTPAYWSLNRYNDFESGYLTEISGIPERKYYNKQILKITFQEHKELATPEVRRTIALLMNEVLRTLLAENQDYLTVLVAEPAQVPVTYDLSGTGGFELDKEAIYILEDSQLDIGLLVAVERNLDRIFSIVFDYLDWHLEELDKSLHPPVPVEPELITVETGEEDKGKKKEGFFKRLWKKLFGSKDGEKKGCLGGLFGKKKKKGEPEGEQPTAGPEQGEQPAGAEQGEQSAGAGEPENGEPGTSEVPEGEGEAGPGTGPEAAAESPQEEPPRKKGCLPGFLRKKKKDGAEPVPETGSGPESDLDAGAADGQEDGLNAGTPENEVPGQEENAPEPAEEVQDDAKLPGTDSDEANVTGEQTEAPAGEIETEEDVPEPEETPSEEATEEPMPEDAGEELPSEDMAEEPSSEETEEKPEDSGNKNSFPHFPMMLFNAEPSLVSDLQELRDEDVPAGGSSESSAGPVREDSSEPAPESGRDPGHEFEFEGDGSTRVTPGSMKKGTARPYHERYYLLYGGNELSSALDPVNTKNLLAAMGYSDSSLRQARKGDSLSKLIEMNYDPRDTGKHYCDFCGKELSGTEYDVLADGRERCVNCSRTAIRSEEEFVKIFRSVSKNMEVYFGIRFTAPVKISMVNSKRLHKRLGKSFVPTAKPDGRTLGVAIKDRDGLSLLVENGSPRVRTAMTMAHELTHIWQYTNWDQKAIRQKYGDTELEIYEGMARWVEIQYAYLVGEVAAGKRTEISTLYQNDEYGRGFIRYVKKYPLSQGSQVMVDTPFDHPEAPL